LDPKVIRAIKVIRATLVHKDLVVNRANEAQLAHRVSRVSLVSVVHKVFKVKLVLPVPKVFRAPRARRAKRVLMALLFSKTLLKNKRNLYEVRMVNLLLMICLPKSN
jgi:hypothetical protein